MQKLALFTLLLVATQSCFAGNYADCLLDKMPNSETDAVVYAVFRTCTEENPQKYFDIEKGSSLGFFGFSDANACILKKAKNTKYQRAASSIAQACQCLYGRSTFKGEMCDYRPVSNWQPEVKPTVIAPALTPIQVPQVVQPAPQAIQQRQIPNKPSKEDLQILAKANEYDLKVKLDMQEIADRAIKQYPYLNQPESKHILDLIVLKREFYIRQGDYPSIALQRAINDFAPAHEPRPTKIIQKQIEIEVKAEQVVDANGCRWVSSIEWKCKKD